MFSSDIFTHLNHCLNKIAIKLADGANQIKKFLSSCELRDSPLLCKITVIYYRLIPTFYMGL